MDQELMASPGPDVEPRHDPHDVKPFAAPNPTGPSGLKPHVFADQAPRLRIARQAYTSVEYPGCIAHPGARSRQRERGKIAKGKTVLDLLGPQPSGYNPNLHPIANPSYVRALYTLGVKPEQLPTQAIPGVQSEDDRYGKVPVSSGVDLASYKVTPVDACFNTAEQGLELNWRPKTRDLVVPVEGSNGEQRDAGEGEGEDGQAGIESREAMDVDGYAASGLGMEVVSERLGASQTEYEPWNVGGNFDSRPIHGERVPVARLLIKVVMRRKRKRVSKDEGTTSADAVSRASTHIGTGYGDAATMIRKIRHSRLNAAAGVEALEAPNIDVIEAGASRTGSRKGKGKAVSFLDTDATKPLSGVAGSTVDADAPSYLAMESAFGGNTSQPDEAPDSANQEGGVFKVEMLGVIRNAVRFRGECQGRPLDGRRARFYRSAPSQ